MDGPGRLEVAPLSKFYNDLRQPLSLLEPSHASMSVLRRRKPAPIAEPAFQVGPIKCAAAPDFCYSEIVVAYLPDAIVTQTGAVVFQDKYVIEETLEGSLEANGLGPATTADALAQCSVSPDVILNVNKLGMWNYSLFTFEVAPSAMLCSLVPGLEKLPAKAFFQRFMTAPDIENRKAIYRLFGIGPDRLMLADAPMCRHRGVVIFKLNDSHRSQRLSQMVTPSCAFLREAFASSAGNTPRRVYISRQRASARRVSNYDELRTKLLTAHGIVPIELERLSVGQQVDVFAKADLVLAEHGAGLANIAFMRPGSHVVEIMPAPIATRAVYRYLAAHFRLNYLYGTLPTPTGWRWDADEVAAPLDVYEALLSQAR